MRGADPAAPKPVLDAHLARIYKSRVRESGTQRHGDSRTITEAKGRVQWQRR